MRKFGLIGRPLGHSFSARYFNDRFVRENIPARYDLYPLKTIEELPALINDNPELAGLNVTIPYKVEVMRYLDALSDEAAGIGAVNVVRIDRKGGGTRLTGFNSDAYGFSESLRRVLDQRTREPENQRAIVLGTGGASKAVVWSLKNMGFTPIIVSRTEGVDRLSYAQLTPQTVNDARVIVNCTPVGMSPNVDAAPPFPFQYLHPGQVCFDLIYNPEETLMMKIAKAHGCVVSNGLEMLRLQAEKSWEIWGGY